ncbi:hypothetical protein B484DRAFT_449535 [Ochromonadaceae sp. CCMP2298]|nr:hypothetical protein B484DRAFT_449535 [Ochromonadaceae sp. CCMP2298]
MQFVVCILVLSMAVLASAFQHQPSFLVKRSTLQMSKGSNQATRIATAVATILSAGVLQLAPVQAANYGGFGSTYSEVLDPKKAEMSETFKSDEVKTALDGVKAYSSAVATMRSDLAKNDQIALSTRLTSELSAGKLRTTLNTYNGAFSEDTQRGTDRLIRNILQDITELQREAIMKPGKERQETKVKLIEKRLAAAESSLIELASFYPN